jgi:hypothetical protein
MVKRIKEKLSKKVYNIFVDILKKLKIKNGKCWNRNCFMGWMRLMFCRLEAITNVL